ncbi:hypothetical protein ACRRTK_022112 [Alexandromys fortis]
MERSRNPEQFVVCDQSTPSTQGRTVRRFGSGKKKEGGDVVCCTLYPREKKKPKEVWSCTTASVLIAMEIEQPHHPQLHMCHREKS